VSGFGLIVFDIAETREIMEFPCVINNRSVALVDMPGFDDTDIPDTDIFTQTTEWLRQSYTDGRKFSGILYLHRVTDNRVGGSAMRNLLMFRNLCGKNFFSDIMLVSTLWDTPASPLQIQNEKDLLNNPKFWPDLIKGGARHSRFHKFADPLSANAQKEARDILQACLDNTPMVLQVQDEMVVQKLSTDQTSAGRTVNADLQRIKLIFDQLAANLKQQYDNEKNEMVKRVFKVEQEQAQAKADKAEKSKQALASFSSPNPSYLSKSGATSLLISAVKSNNTKNARRLIRDNNANTDATDSRGRPILSLAVEQKHYDMVELLLKNDASPTKTDKYGTSPLHVAARAGYLRITTKLIDYATTLNKHDYDGRTPLYIACDNNRSRITKELLDRGAYIRARSARGNTVLHAAARQGFKDLCKILV
jgi:hypothetical protein